MTLIAQLLATLRGEGGRRGSGGSWRWMLHSKWVKWSVAAVAAAAPLVAVGVAAGCANKMSDSCAGQTHTHTHTHWHTQALQVVAEVGVGN